MKKLQTWPWPQVLTMGLSLRSRILLAAILPIAAIAFYFIQNLNSQRRLAQTTHEILDHRVTMMRAAEDIKQALVSYDDAMFRYLALQNGDHVKEAQHWKQETEKNLATLKNLSISPILSERLDILQSESEQYFLDAEKVVDYAHKTRVSAADLQKKSSNWRREDGRTHLELAFLSAEGKTRLIRVFALCDEILTINRMELERAQEEMSAVLRNAHRTGILLSLFATGAMTILGAGFILSLVFPLRNLMTGIERIKEGDLEVAIPVTTLDEVGELTSAFNQATITIRQQREQLLKETVTDGLTGTYNQRYFRQVVRQEIDRAARSGHPLSLLMIDLDHFKEFNDTFGHEAGNEMLKKLTGLLRDTIREIDILARYGGDEFAVILPETPAECARTIAQRMVETASALSIGWKPATMSIPTLALSIGGASYPSEATSAEMLIHKADEALYQAKAAGRSRVSWTGGPSGSPMLEVAPH